MADRNYESHAFEKDVVILNQTFAPNDPLLYSDILKFSLCENILVKDCWIEGGKEDAIDCVRGNNYQFSHLTIHPFGKNGFTIKGSIENSELNDILFTRHGTECDIELGQHCIYDTFFGANKTKKTKLINVRANDGKPVIVKVWNADSPIVIDSHVKIKKMPWIVVKIYFALRYLKYHWTKK